ncbi:hypothetical protein LX16_2710 [Stackebrandtia albiflava]|uniref:Uncharacterized protein n=1 Tax=Stackebrandtia albiflava TaxID=406432 RepID=A0A562V2C8_9ACTN|nr:hypothetical protein [Stackebrandtia albiflava]TWJ11967.1 hypothetical protein LX16_2710 [Stackebrandtia albiflava]
MGKGRDDLIAFQKNHADDIETADDLVRQYIVPSGKDAATYLPSTIIGWFAAIDTDALRRRWKIIDELGTDGKNPYEDIFGAPTFNNTMEHWTGETATGLARYAVGRGGGEYSLQAYINDVVAKAKAHAKAAENFITELGARQEAMAGVCNETIKGLNGRLWREAGKIILTVGLAGSRQDAVLQSIGQFYSAAVDEAEHARTNSEVLRTHGALMKNDAGPRINTPALKLGPTDRNRLAGI